MAPLLQRLEDLYRDFLAADVHKIREVYADKVVFRDPVHELQGLPALEGYFAGMAQNLRECRFAFDQVLVQGERAALWWIMHYRHPKLGGGRPLTLRGASLLTLDLNADRVLAHEDVYDLGAMVYEHIPVLGSVVNMVKSRLAAGDHQAREDAGRPGRLEKSK